MGEKFMFLFWSNPKSSSLLMLIIYFFIFIPTYFLWYFSWNYYHIDEFDHFKQYLRFFWNDFEINFILVIILNVIVFVLFNYLIFLSWKFLKLKKINITEVNKNYFLIYAKFVPIWYIVSNFILWWNSSYSYLKVFLYWLLWVIMNLSFVWIMWFLYYLAHIENYYFRELVNFLAFTDLIVSNVFFLIFSFIYFKVKK